MYYLYISFRTLRCTKILRCAKEYLVAAVLANEISFGAEAVGSTQSVPIEGHRKTKRDFLVIFSLRCANFPDNVVGNVAYRKSRDLV